MGPRQHLIATTVSYGEEDGVFTLGFANEASDVAEYLLLQWKEAYEEQDKVLGMDKIYLEYSEQSRSCYGGIGSISAGHREIIIDLTQRAAETLQVEGPIEITIKTPDDPDVCLTDLLSAVAGREEAAFREQQRN